MFAVTQKYLLLAAFTASASLLAACSSTPAKPPPEVTQIRLLPVAPIERLYTQNDGVPIGVLWQAIADRVKSNDFNERMSATRLALAPRLTAALQRELSVQGFQVSILEGVPRLPDAPDNVDYGRIPGKVPVLHVYFSELGMLSSRFSLDYLPKVNIDAALLVPGADDYIYEERIYYGADADGTDARDKVPSDPRHKWSSFDALVAQPDVAIESYEAGVDAVARQIAANIKSVTVNPQRVTDSANKAN